MLIEIQGPGLQQVCVVIASRFGPLEDSYSRQFNRLLFERSMFASALSETLQHIGVLRHLTDSSSETWKIAHVGSATESDKSDRADAQWHHNLSVEGFDNSTRRSRRSGHVASRCLTCKVKPITSGNNTINYSCTQCHMDSFTHAVVLIVS